MKLIVSLTSAQSDFPSEEVELKRIISIILTREAPAAPHKHYISLILHCIAFNAHKLESVLDNAWCYEPYIGCEIQEVKMGKLTD